MSNSVTIAAGCFAPRWHASARDLRDEVFERVAQADAALSVFPEYGAMATALIGTPDGDPDALVWAKRAAAAQADWVALIRGAAMEYGQFILAGSGPVKVGAHYVNRAVFCAPDGSVAHQDKQIPTPWERSDMNMVRGDGLTLFDTPLGKIGVTICYDAEFPLFARALVAAGQDRVQIGARARALENQCLVVQAPMHGVVQGCDPVAENIGQAGMFGPPDLGQPAGGLHALGKAGTQGWLRHTIDLEQITAARTTGHVKVFSDWPAQGIPDLAVKIVTLGK